MAKRKVTPERLAEQYASLQAAKDERKLISFRINVINAFGSDTMKKVEELAKNQ